MKYHLNIIDNNVELPKEIDIIYNDVNVAYNALSTFVHSFDGIKQVDGRVCDENDNDIEYSSSIKID